MFMVWRKEERIPDSNGETNGLQFGKFIKMERGRFKIAILEIISSHSEFE